MFRIPVIMAMLLLAITNFGNAQDGTYFTDGTGTFTSVGDWQTQEFTIYGKRTFMMRVAADYKVQYAIIKAGQLNSFRNNGAFSGYGSFNGTFGYHGVTLAAGTYYAAIRSMVSASNSYRWELDKVLSVPGYYVAGNGIRAASNVNPNGGKLYHKFTIASGYRYYMDGCNSGVQTDVIPASSLQNYLNNQTYNYYPTLSGTGTDMPGFYRLNLAVGSYYLCFRNDASITKTATYLMQYYRRY